VQLGLEHVVEAFVDPLSIPVEELAVHVDGLVERVAPRLVQEAHQRERSETGTALSGIDARSRRTVQQQGT